MSEATTETITNLITAFNASAAQSLDVKTADFELHLNKAATATATANPAVLTTPAGQQPKQESSEQARPVVKAPLVGVAYLAPEPGKPPFVQVGDYVHAGQTVCVIEAMKLINEVPSPVSGTVKRILVQDANMVEYDEPLIELEGASPA